jgi:hypothetical protein
VAVAGTTAYVADEAAGLRVVDVSNPMAPAEVGFYDTPGYAEGLAVAGPYAYVADYDGGLAILGFADRLHLNALKLAWRSGPQPATYKVAAAVRVHGDDHAAVPGVTVYGDWTLPNSMVLHKTALTNAQGQARFSLPTKQTGTFEFCVTDMAMDGYVYFPAANERPICKNIVVGP